MACKTESIFRGSVFHSRSSCNKSLLGILREVEPPTRSGGFSVKMLLFVATAQDADSGYGRHAEEQDQKVIRGVEPTVQPLLLPPSSFEEPELPLLGRGPVVTRDTGSLMTPGVSSASNVPSLSPITKKAMYDLSISAYPLRSTERWGRPYRRSTSDRKWNPAVREQACCTCTDPWSYHGACTA